ncbi:YqhG family protein [Alicyclobacillus herbarius]|uniref:YqhG family protein n=1 Tax=Alicyclobacillus herbarius TaxID=122960 RepID=UPI0003F55C68|nr:YqhG family protein [Alicyclobacillus herbarius]
MAGLEQDMKPRAQLSDTTAHTLPLRTADERMRFCERYLQALGATEQYKSEFYMEYVLPLDVDKELSDRPYFWMWVEQTGQKVEPSVLRLAFTEEAAKRENQRLRDEAWQRAETRGMSDIERMFFRPPTCELISLGSFRLEKIFDSLEKRGRFACVAPIHVGSGADHRLIPWLMVNVMVSCKSDLTQQSYRSLAVCLENGQMIDRFYAYIKHIPMRVIRSDELLHNVRLSISEAFAKVRDKLHQDILRSDMSWAIRAQENLKQELDQIDLYYDSLLYDVSEEERAILEKERNRKRHELRERSAPRVEITFRQAALIGLPERTMHSGSPSRQPDATTNSR